MNQKITFAFAVNHSNAFEPHHFGDADKYLIFEWNDNDMTLKGELINTFKVIDEVQAHGTKKKGNAIINLLKEHNVQVLVSRQFGKNIKMVNQYFIPVIIDKETSEAALSALSSHITWIKDELKNNLKAYKLFTIRKGILKTIIAKEN